MVHCKLAGQDLKDISCSPPHVLFYSNCQEDIFEQDNACFFFANINTTVKVHSRFSWLYLVDCEFELVVRNWYVQHKKKSFSQRPRWHLQMTFSVGEHYDICLWVVPRWKYKSFFFNGWRKYKLLWTCHSLYRTLSFFTIAIGATFLQFPSMFCLCQYIIR